MLQRILLLLILYIFAPSMPALAHAEGADTLASADEPVSVAMEKASVECEMPVTMTDSGTVRGFDKHGIVPHRIKKETYWSHVPADCHIDWRRKRERPFHDFCLDLAHFFNTYDTTYVERNRYNFRVMAMNTNYFQSYRIAGRYRNLGIRQILAFSPTHVFKLGPRAGWRWAQIGYTFGVVPYSRHKSQELNFAAYNSRIGCDFNWQHSAGPFTLQRTRGIADLPDYAMRGVEVEGISTNTIAMNVYYVFNYRHFSYPAAYNACTVQLKSSGSWMLGASYDYQHFAFDPDEAERTIRDFYATKFPSSTTVPTLIDPLRISKVNYHRIGVSVGYGYNWVPARGWLVSASAAPSLGFKKQADVPISRQMIADNIRNLHVDAIFRGAVAYNRQRWFAGASVVSYLYDYRHRQFSLNNNVTYLKFFVGMQFHKRKKFRLAGESKW